MSQILNTFVKHVAVLFVLCFVALEAIARVIFCVNPTFVKKRFQFMDQVFTTECLFCLVERYRISQFGIAEDEFARSRPWANFLMCCFRDYKYHSKGYISRASFELQCDILVQFREEILYFCYPSVFQQQGCLLNSHKSCFANANEAYSCFFEYHVNV